MLTWRDVNCFRVRELKSQQKSLQHPLSHCMYQVSKFYVLRVSKEPSL